ncbi:MAG: DNA gyrase inhibitor YacG [Planctomycetota bacterium]
MKHRCPVCHKIVRTSVQKPPEETKFFPFCSQRCKLVDLGAWLDAKYAIASTPQSQEPGNPPNTTYPSDKL